MCTYGINCIHTYKIILLRNSWWKLTNLTDHKKMPRWQNHLVPESCRLFTFLSKSAINALDITQASGKLTATFPEELALHTVSSQNFRSLPLSCQKSCIVNLFVKLQCSVLDFHHLTSFSKYWIYWQPLNPVFY